MEIDLPHQVIGACMEVHRILGAGLTRDVYDTCLAVELRQMEMRYERAKPLTFLYRDTEVKAETKLDFIVERELLIMVKAVDELSDQDKADMESLMRLSNLRSGLLVNFRVPVLRKGIHRVVLKRREQDS
jgi:GxxExxY protein